MPPVLLDSRGRFQTPDPPQILGEDGAPLRRDPDYGTMALPQVLTFAGLLGSSYKAYIHGKFDEAIRDSRPDALAMRRDPYLMGLLQERKLSVSSLPWHLEIPDENDQFQRQARDDLTQTLKRIRGLRRIIKVLLEALWYGRYGVQFKWQYKERQGYKYLTVKRWMPVNGDKIGWMWDDEHPYVLVNSAKAVNLKGAEVINATIGRALVLQGPWRERFVIHQHEIDDGDYFDAEMAEGAHGVGIRSRLYWLNWVKLEWLEWVTTYLERVGLGLTVWEFDASNPSSKTAAEAAAKAQDRKVNVLVPVWPDAKGGYSGGIKRIETPVTGVEALRTLIDKIDDVMERYVVGQQMSSQSKPAGLGNEQAVAFQQDTKLKITQDDAWNLADTLTGTEEEPGLVSILHKYTHPWADFPVSFVFDVERTQSEEKLRAGRLLFEMGIAVKTDELRAAAGFTKPTPNDEVTKKPEQPMMPGMEGDPSQGQAAPPGPGEDSAGSWEPFSTRTGTTGWKNPLTGERRYGEKRPGREDVASTARKSSFGSGYTGGGFKHQTNARPGQPKQYDKLPGGKGDRLPEDAFDQEQLADGIKVEMEHTKDRALASEIARDHLTEDPDYYRKLRRAGLADELGPARKARAGRPLQYMNPNHAPHNVTIQGQQFRGGEFIPAEVMAAATPEEKKQVWGEPAGNKQVPAPQAPAPPTTGPAKELDAAQSGQTPPAGDVRATFRAGMQGLSLETAAEYAKGVEDVLAAMPEAARAAVAANLEGARFYPDAAALTAAWSAETGRRASGRITGYVNHETGVVHIDGRASGRPSVHGTYAHELAHVIDRNSRLTKDGDWVRAFRAEIVGLPHEAPPLSEYARLAGDPREGFAEFGRALWGSPVPRETLEQRFPLCCAFFRKHGLL